MLARDYLVAAVSAACGHPGPSHSWALIDSFASRDEIRLSACEGDKRWPRRRKVRPGSQGADARPTVCNLPIRAPYLLSALLS